MRSEPSDAEVDARGIEGGHEALSDGRGWPNAITVRERLPRIWGRLESPMPNDEPLSPHPNANESPCFDLSDAGRSRTDRSQDRSSEQARSDVPPHPTEPVPTGPVGGPRAGDPEPDDPTVSADPSRRRFVRTVGAGLFLVTIADVADLTGLRRQAEANTGATCGNGMPDESCGTFNPDQNCNTQNDPDDRCGVGLDQDQSCGSATLANATDESCRPFAVTADENCGDGLGGANADPDQRCNGINDSDENCGDGRGTANGDKDQS